MTDTVDLLGALIAGKYRLRRRIGIGGMGTVYEAMHVELGKRVAIKVIDAAGAVSPEIVMRFKREARAASALESENIVQVFDVGFDPDVGLFMVMELLKGEDLESRLRRDGRVDVMTAVQIGHQTARALGKAHALRVVHRDLKPANIFLSTNEEGALRVKVLDFGISKIGSDIAVSKSPDALALTQEGIALGTPQYMSPEQARGLSTIDGRADLWSLGAVLYEALSGRPAYAPGAPEQVMYKVLREDPPPLASIAPVPPELARLIHDALTRDVNRRVPDCQTFARRLAAALPAAAPAGRGSASWPSAASAMDDVQTQVLAHAREDATTEEELEDEGPDTFRDGIDIAIDASSPDPVVVIDGAPQPETRRDFPPPAVVHADVAVRAVADAPEWIHAPRRPPSTLGSAIRSLSIPPLPPREVFAATVTACAVILVGGALIWGSRVMLGEASPSDVAASPSPPPVVDAVNAAAPAPPSFAGPAGPAASVDGGAVNAPRKTPMKAPR